MFPVAKCVSLEISFHFSLKRQIAVVVWPLLGPPRLGLRSLPNCIHVVQRSYIWAAQTLSGTHISSFCPIHGTTARPVPLAKATSPGTLGLQFMQLDYGFWPKNKALIYGLFFDGKSR